MPGVSAWDRLRGGKDMRLTAKRIAKLRKRPRGKPYPDGHGLHLQVKSLNAASWLFRYERNGRDRWMGLGPLHTGLPRSSGPVGMLV